MSSTVTPMTLPSIRSEGEGVGSADGRQAVGRYTRAMSEYTERLAAIADGLQAARGFL